jgi:hypothetical protein
MPGYESGLRNRRRAGRPSSEDEQPVVPKPDTTTTARRFRPKLVEPHHRLYVRRYERSSKAAAGREREDEHLVSVADFPAGSAHGQDLPAGQGISGMPQFILPRVDVAEDPPEVKDVDVLHS